MAVHAAMIDRMDIEIGRVIDQLRAMNKLDDTLILFLSDNGASAEIMVRGDGHDPNVPVGAADSFVCLGPGWSKAANTPFRRHKTWVHEGGISTSMIAHWPRGIKQTGAWRSRPGHVIDVVPTILELAGGTWPAQSEGLPIMDPALRGESFLGCLTGDDRPALHRCGGCMKRIKRSGATSGKQSLRKANLGNSIISQSIARNPTTLRQKSLQSWQSLLASGRLSRRK